MGSFVTALALVLAAAVALDIEAPAEGECCAVDACAGHQDESGASDECPPGCDDGCVCCVRLTAVPAASSPVLRALVVHTIVYDVVAELAPPAPEPRDRDFVPRDATSAI